MASKNDTVAAAGGVDFVKLLPALESQFKVISEGDLKAITKTMRQLLDGLKQSWINKLDLKIDDAKFEQILLAISNEICQQVVNKIDIQTIFTQKKPKDAIADIEDGIEVL